jgi:MFS family permease
MRSPAGFFGSILRPLGDQGFRRYYTGQALSHFGDSLIPVALAFGALRIGASPSQLGLVLLASRLPQVLFTVLGGVVGDRLSRRHLMLTSDLVRGGVQAATAALLITSNAEIWHLVVLQAIVGTATAFFEPAAAGIVADLVPPGDRQEANALLAVSQNLATLLSPFIAATLIATVGTGAAFAVDAATFALSAVALWRLRMPSRAAEAALEATSMLADARRGWAEFRRRRWLVVFTAQLTAINGLCVGPFLVLGPVVAERDLGGARAWAIVGIGYAVGGLAGSALALRWHPRYPLRTAVAGTLALAPLMALLAAGAPAVLLALAALPAGVQAAVHAVLFATTRQQHVPGQFIARVAAVSSLAGFAALPIGMALAGPLAELIGVGTVLSAAAAVVIGSAVLALSSSGLRRLPGTPELAPDDAAAVSSGGPTQDT